MEQHKACHCCGMIHRLPVLESGQLAACVRCETVIYGPVGGHDSAALQRSASRTAAAATAAFVLFWPAVLLPILKIEQLGHSSESSILLGIVELLRHGNWFVGGVVLLFSIIFPLVKIVLLLELSLLGLLKNKHKALT